MSDIILKNVSKSYDGKVVLDNFDLTVKEGKITCILGGSGVGKTTLLNVIAGLTDFKGEVSGADEVKSYVFQEPRLIRSYTVRQNLDFILKSVIADKEERGKRISEALDAVGLNSNAASYPHELSIGMAQRVAMARAFLFPSRIIFMDEPFRGLDIATKAKLISYFLSLWEKEGRTVVLVTHNVDEAVLLSDDIYVLAGEPAAVTAHFGVDGKKSERVMSDPKLSAVFAEIYKLFN